MLVTTRLLIRFAAWISLMFPWSAEASTGAEAISVSPFAGPPGQKVTVMGTGWQEHGTRGIDVPIWIGFANVVARGQPDANGTFSVSLTIPQSAKGDLTISAIIGNGGSADAIYRVTTTVGGQLRVETFREGVLVFFRVLFAPSDDIVGFGFRGIKGSGWAEETHPFTSPSYGRVSPGMVEYPFNHLCGTHSEYASDVEAWIYDRAGKRISSITVHLACSAPSAGKACVFLHDFAPALFYEVGHLAWGWKVVGSNPERWVFGSTDGKPYVINISPGNDNGFWVVSERNAKDMNAMFHNIKGYKQLKCRTTVTSAMEAARTEIESVRHAGFGFIGNNCMNHTIRLLTAYGVPSGSMPDPSKEVTPLNFFNHLTGWTQGDGATW